MTPAPAHCGDRRDAQRQCRISKEIAEGDARVKADQVYGATGKQDHALALRIDQTHRLM
jgi:hypothetical protein